MEPVLGEVVPGPFDNRLLLQNLLPKATVIEKLMQRRAGVTLGLVKPLPGPNGRARKGDEPDLLRVRRDADAGVLLLAVRDVRVTRPSNLLERVLDRRGDLLAWLLPRCSYLGMSFRQLKLAEIPQNSENFDRDVCR